MNTQTYKAGEEIFSINQEQELYVIHLNDGFTCLGFDVCIDWGRKISIWLGNVSYAQIRGTPEAYQAYRKLCELGRQKFEATKQRCPALLTPQLVGLEGKRVEMIDCNGDTRRFYVGKSTGWLPVHLELSRKNSSGGPAVYGDLFKAVRVIGRSR
jgi:hypothetical protein